MRFQPLSVLLLLPSWALAQQTPPDSLSPAPTPNLVALAPTLAPDATVRELASGLKFTEGAVWNKGGFWLFSDLGTNTLWKLAPSGQTEIIRRPSGNSNGNAYDLQNRLVACEHGSRRVSRKMPNGEFETLADNFEGKKLNSPNDLAIKSDGSVYFSDPTYGVRAEQSELGFRGLFRISPDGKLELLDKDFEQPNGLAFSPDEKKLYVGDSQGKKIWIYDVDSKGAISNKTLFDSVTGGDPDGMKTDANGNLYVTTGQGVRVYARLGGFLGLIPTPKPAANLAFGGSNGKTLLICARGSVYSVELTVGEGKRKTRVLKPR